MRHLLASLLLIVYWPAAVASAGTNHIVVIDAGSGGSRVHVYRYHTPHGDDLPQFVEIFHKTVQPGLAVYAGAPQLAAASVKPLFADAKAAIEHDGGNSHRAQIELLGTAGMRLEPKVEQQRVYDAIKSAVYANDFASVTATTIDGWEEALYAWLTVNHLAHKLEGNPGLTSGVLEMGGASSQIAFHTTDASAHVHRFTLNGKPHTVLAHSFLGLGQDLALDNLAKFSTRASDVGYCFPHGFTYHLHKLHGKGKYNHEKCVALTRKLVASFNIKREVPALDRSLRYTALSGYYFVFHFFDANSRIDFLDHTTSQRCTQSWRNLTQVYPNENSAWLAKRCFQSDLFANVLGTDVGYGFAKNSQQLDITDQIDHQCTEWAVGAALFTIAGKHSN